MNYLSKSISRRTILRGAGAALALPFLDAMVPALRAARKPVRRFQAFYTPYGLSMDGPANAGACTGNLSCAYTHTISWRSKMQPLPMEQNPRTVFEKIFGDSGSTNLAARNARMQQHKSLLDSVNEKLSSLKRDL